MRKTILILLVVLLAGALILSASERIKLIRVTTKNHMEAEVAWKLRTLPEKADDVIMEYYLTLQPNVEPAKFMEQSWTILQDDYVFWLYVNKELVTNPYCLKSYKVSDAEEGLIIDLNRNTTVHFEGCESVKEFKKPDGNYRLYLPAISGYNQD